MDAYNEKFNELRKNLNNQMGELLGSLSNYLFDFGMMNPERFNAIVDIVRKYQFILGKGIPEMAKSKKTTKTTTTKKKTKKSKKK